MLYQTPVETYRSRSGKLVCEIYPDEFPDDPRKWDNLGTMITSHRKYILGDECVGDFWMWLLQSVGTDFEWEWYDWFVSHNAPKKVRDRLLERFKKQNIVLPLYLYDHSGLRLRTYGFHDPWDSGQVGFIFVPIKWVKKEFGWKRLTRKRREHVEKLLRAEVDTYDQYLNGEVYCLVLKDDQGDIVDSVCGVYRDDVEGAMKCIFRDNGEELDED